jgi:predicted nucleotidyltransferase
MERDRSYLLDMLEAAKLAGPMPMVELEDIRSLADRIARAFRPERIILFGSYAWGAPTPDSDVDLLVVLPFEGKGWCVASEIRCRTRPGFPLDLLVRTPEQLRERLLLRDTFMHEITQRGKVLHAACDG